MKLSSGFFAVLLVFWSGFSAYWYVCKIQNDCEKKEIKPVTETSTQNDKKNTVTKEKNTDIAATDTLSVITDIGNKLKNGYTLNYFPVNSGKAEKTGEDLKEFAENLKIYMSKNKDVKIKITGYTDNTGTPEINVKIGKKRAEFLKKKLTEYGIDENRIVTASEGEKNPIADNESEEGRNKNRRAVIEIINK